MYSCAEFSIYSSIKTKSAKYPKENCNNNNSKATVRTKKQQTDEMEKYCKSYNGAQLTPTI